MFWYKYLHNYNLKKSVNNKKSEVSPRFFYDHIKPNKSYFFRFSILSSKTLIFARANGEPWEKHSWKKFKEIVKFKIPKSAGINKM